MHRTASTPLPSGWSRCVRSAVVHVVSIANVAFTVTRARAANEPDGRIRLQAELDQRDREISLLREELRIKDARMQRVPAQRRPHYPAIERLASLELRAARGWSQAETARRLLVTPLTVASWTRRLDDDGPDALVQMPEPVNRFPELVSYLVRRLRVLCPRMGSRRIARVLARAGLHLGATTVRRMLQPVPNRNDHWPDKRHVDPSPRNAQTTSGTLISRRFPRTAASGSPGGRSPFRSAGRSAGGSRSSPITSPAVPWGRRTSRRSRPPTR